MGSQVLSPKSLEVNTILDVESVEIGTYHLTRGPESDMDAYMATLFGDEARDSC